MNKKIKSRSVDANSAELISIMEHVAIPRFESERKATKLSLYCQRAAQAFWYFVIGKGKIYGHFDGVQDNKLRGWVWDPANSENAVDVQLCVGDSKLLISKAGIYRADLLAAAIGLGRHGYEVEVPSKILSLAKRSGQKLKLTTVGHPIQTLCTIDLSSNGDRSIFQPNSIKSSYNIRMLSKLIIRTRRLFHGLIARKSENLTRISYDFEFKENEALSAAVRRSIELRIEGLETFAKLTLAEDQATIRVRTNTQLASTSSEKITPAYIILMDSKCSDGNSNEIIKDTVRLSTFSEYIRRRHDLEFAPDKIIGDLEKYYKWYIGSYNRSRAPLRSPLSVDEIAYLTESIAIEGATFPLPRVVVWYALEDARMRVLLSDQHDKQAYLKITYWWACERAAELNVEDCLVTANQIDYLSSKLPGWERKPFPLCPFLQITISNRPDLVSFGNVLDISVRVAVYFTLLLEAPNQVGILRFFPAVTIDAFFRGSDPLFDRLLVSLHVGAPSLNSTIYRKLLTAIGYDLESKKFLTIDKAGHRAESVRPIEFIAQQSIDVQVIGPFSKASGIGQMTRMSSEVLKLTGLNSAFVDFALDNPQPQQAIDESVGSEVKRAKVNLIHLNADLLPLAFAFLPDVFSGAYNIGFFFWELDRPGDCDQLALDLVDEIWVASEYNRKCYSHSTSKPVVNVGTAVSDIIVPNRGQARASLNRAFGYRNDDFVFFASYDTLSFPQRKNPLGLVHAFQDAFPGDPSARLLIKTQNATVGVDSYRSKIWQTLKWLSTKDPRITIVNETMGHSDLMSLKAGTDCFVSLHRSEGFGLGLLEAMKIGIPVMCTAYSGNMDYCSSDTAWLIAFDEVQVGKDDYVHVSPGSLWSRPQQKSAAAQMREVRENAVQREQRVAAAKKLVFDQYSPMQAAKRYLAQLQRLGIEPRISL